MTENQKDTSAVLEVVLSILNTSFYKDTDIDQSTAEEYCNMAVELLQWHFDCINGREYQLSPATAKMIDEFSGATLQ